MRYLLDRLREPSTYAGLAVLLAALGYAVPTETMEALRNLGIAAAGLAAVLLRERPAPAPPMPAALAELATAATGARPPAPVAATPAPVLTDRDRDVLIRTVYGEARGEPREGQIAVVHVIRNRATDERGRWPRGVAEVCLQPSQFSCWLPSDPNLPVLRRLQPTSPAYLSAAEVVDAAWRMPDSVLGANHYYAPAGMPGGRPPSWAQGRPYVLRLGGHLFFRL